MKISRQDVEHVARLARLSLAEDELDMMTEQLDAVLGYVEKLNQLDTEGIVPTSHAVPMENAFRADEITPPRGVSWALQNAPESTDDCFAVPKVIE